MYSIQHSPSGQAEEIELSLCISCWSECHRPQWFKATWCCHVGHVPVHIVQIRICNACCNPRVGL